MALLENLALVFVAGLITALATGLGALPFSPSTGSATAGT